MCSPVSGSGSDVSLKDELEPLRGMIDERLREYVEVGPDCPERLREAMTHSLMAGGKRLRPILVLLACEACGGQIESALPAACAVEMVHTYSLIHDDLPAMDDDDWRRGRPTCHVEFGEALAILAGDGLLTLAFEVLAEQVRPAETAAACCAALAAAAGVCGMVGGQAADLEATATDAADAALLQSIHRRKTGRLIACSLELGARIAGTDDAIRRTLIEYGHCVGLAFQIADDLLDVTGQRVKMGKSVGKASDLGKLTYPSLLGEEESRQQARRLIERARQAVAVLGERGRRLDALAQFIIERDH